MRRSVLGFAGPLLALALVTAACGDDEPTPQTTGTTPPAQLTTDTPAAALRSDLNRLLQEHVFLAALATDAGLAGATDQFEAAATALDGNSDDIINTFGSVYPDAKATFNDAWRGHIGFVVDYVTGLATEDQAKQDQAVSDLQGYWESFGQFLSDTVATLPDGPAVSALVMKHVLTLKTVIDAQAARDPGSALTALREAAGHMHMIGDPLAAAIAQDKGVEGSATDAASGLRSSLNQLLQEHVYLAAIAATGALSANTPVFEAAATALDGNSDDIINTFGSVYPDAKATFNDAWKGHIGFVVDYVTGLATEDQAKQDQAVSDLQGYWESFGQFLSDTVATLPEGPAVSALVMEHVLTLKTVIDDFAGGDVEAGFSDLRAAAGHMHMIGDPLAGAIVADNPQAFEG
jgi:hypothetical protein